jgi:hypothetical protein
MATLPEEATVDIKLKASPELLNEMQKGWSRPLQVIAEQSPQGDWSLAFRIPEGAEPEKK